MDSPCVCGKYHRNFDHFFEIHGEYVPIPPFLIQVPFLSSGERWDESYHSDTEPYPCLIYDWICEFCQARTFKTIEKEHNKGCSFIKFLELRKLNKWEITPQMEAEVWGEQSEDDGEDIIDNTIPLSPPRQEREGRPERTWRDNLNDFITYYEEKIETYSRSNNDDGKPDFNVWDEINIFGTKTENNYWGLSEDWKDDYLLSSTDDNEFKSKKKILDDVFIEVIITHLISEKDKDRLIDFIGRHDSNEAKVIYRSDKYKTDIESIINSSSSRKRRRKEKRGS